MKQSLLLCLLLGSLFCLSSAETPNTNALPDEDMGISCSKSAEINETIELAIAVGAPTYNMGNYIGCYFIYEGAAYKVIHLYGSKCREVKKILETALADCKKDNSVSEKAWIMRMAFDKILGVETQMEPAKKDDTRGS